MAYRQDQIPNGLFSSVFETSKEWLEHQSHAVIWRIVALGMASVFALDFFMAPFGVQSGLFYLMPICLACWRISYRAGLFLGFMASILAAVLGFFVTNVPLNSVLGTMVMNASALSILGVIVESFRKGVERERFFANLDHMTRALTKKAFEQRRMPMERAKIANSSRVAGNSQSGAVPMLPRAWAIGGAKLAPRNSAKL